MELGGGRASSVQANFSSFSQDRFFSCHRSCVSLCVARSKSEHLHSSNRICICRLVICICGSEGWHLHLSSREIAAREFDAMRVFGMCSESPVTRDESSRESSVTRNESERMRAHRRPARRDLISGQEMHHHRQVIVGGKRSLAPQRHRRDFPAMHTHVVARFPSRGCPSR